MKTSAYDNTENFHASEVHSSNTFKVGLSTKEAIIFGKRQKCFDCIHCVFHNRWE